MIVLFLLCAFDYHYTWWQACEVMV